MTNDHIRNLVKYYEHKLYMDRVKPEQMEKTFKFSKLTTSEILSHAYWLCINIHNYIGQAGSEGKVGRHLASIQMCLSFAGKYTLEELMDHNRDDAWLEGLV